MSRNPFGHATGVLLALLLLCSAGGPGCNGYRLAPLQRSTAVTAQLADVSEPQAEAAIELALAKRGWHVVDKVPGRLTAELSERVHRVRIQIVYGPPGVVINYLESDNLMYTRDASGNETIHRKYATWVKNLGSEIQIAIAATRAQTVPPPSVPVTAT